MDNKQTVKNDSVHSRETRTQENLPAVHGATLNKNATSDYDNEPSTSVLPGTVVLPSTCSQKLGKSKSDQSIRIIKCLDTDDNMKLQSVNIDLNALPSIPKADTRSSIVSHSSFATDFLKKKSVQSNEESQASIDNIKVAKTEAVVQQNTNTTSVCCNIQTDLPEPIIPKDEVIVTAANGKTVIAKHQPPSRNTSNLKKSKDNSAEKVGFAVAHKDSMSSIGSNVCRICMTRGKERLISPCNCKGSLANVHLTCLERWLNQVGRNHCELCGFSYPAIRTPRYTVLQALRLWFGNPRNRTHLQSDCLIFWLLSTVTAGLVAVCVFGTQYFVIEGGKLGKHEAVRKTEGISHRVTETAMDFFMAIVLCGYTVTVYLLCKDHYVMWNRWRRANVNVRLLLTPDASPVPFVPRPRFSVV